MKIAILDDYHNVATTMADWSSLSPAEITVFNEHIADVDHLAQRLDGFDVVCLMRERTPFPRTLIEILDKLRLIVTAGRQNAAIDLDAATQRGIVVSGTTGLIQPMPELAWGLIFATLRDIPRADQAIRAGRWQAGVRIGTGLHDKRMGFVGLGRTGQIMARQAEAFGAKPLAWSPNLTDERADAAGVQRVSRSELFATADIVVVLMRLSSSTEGLVRRADLERMQPHAYFINTSRGKLVDESALVDVLRQRRIAGAGLDVFVQEPINDDHPLLALDNVVLTPHLGYVTTEHLEKFYVETVDAIAAFQAGKPIRVLNEPSA